MKELRIELLSRPGCHLCEVAHRDLLELSREFPLRVVEVDISKDLDLLRRYRNHIPVGLLEGEELFRHRVNSAELRERLRSCLEDGDLSGEGR